MVCQISDGQALEPSLHLFTVGSLFYESVNLNRICYKTSINIEINAMSNLVYITTLVLIVVWAFVCFVTGVYALSVFLAALAAMAVILRVVQGRRVLR